MLPEGSLNVFCNYVERPYLTSELLIGALYSIRTIVYGFCFLYYFPLVIHSQLLLSLGLGGFQCA